MAVIKNRPVPPGTNRVWIGDPWIVSADEDNGLSQRAKLSGIMIVSALIVAVVIGIAWVFRFADAERERDLRMWQIRLGLVANSRAEAVGGWIGQQLRTVADLADNPSLQLYMTQVAFGDGAIADSQGQAAYLRNLLIATASRGGFEAPLLGPDVAANVERIGTAGLALIDTTGVVLVATAAMPDMDRRLFDAVRNHEGDVPWVVDMYMGAADQPTMAFVAPVFGIQAGPGEGAPIGFVIGARLIADGLFERLAQPGDVDRDAETFLVRTNAATIEYLSPLGDGTRAMELSLAKDTHDLAAAFAAGNPGGFGQRVDYRGEDVLVTGRNPKGVAWTLVRTVTVARALGQGDTRRNGLLVLLVITIFGVAVSVLLVWRHGSSLRSAEAADRYRKMSERYSTLSDFLRVVADGQPTAIATVDAHGRYSFANLKAAREAGMSEAHIVGKTMTDVLGPPRARLYEPLNQEALASGQPVFKTQTVDGADGPRIIKSGHIPLETGSGQKAEVLMVFEDITELVTERERRENNLRQLVNTILAIVDSRDPFAARHSARVGEVAEAVGQEMGLGEIEVETAEIAGSLMNLGKILVPRDILTTSESLSSEDLENVRDAMLSSAELLKNVDFDGPVVATMREAQARWDGGGTPVGLEGEDILITARVVAVANTFVGMVSARADRPGKSIDDAQEYLVSKVGTIFDRRPVAALVNVLDNRGGRERWSHFGEVPAD